METSTLSSVLSAWPSLGDVAADAGVQEVAVRRWIQRRSIPSKRLAPLVDGARRRGIAVDIETLVRASGGGE